MSRFFIVLAKLTMLVALTSPLLMCLGFLSGDVYGYFKFILEVALICSCVSLVSLLIGLLMN